MPKNGHLREPEYSGRSSTSSTRDGVHYQLDPSYHIAAIADFMEITEVLDANGRSDLLGNVLETLESAMTFVADITYPDYSIDNFNDTRSASYTPSVLKRNFNSYSEAFPFKQLFQVYGYGRCRRRLSVHIYEQLHLFRILCYA